MSADVLRRGLTGCVVWRGPRGEIIDAMVMEGRGFGFVTFEDPRNAQNFLEVCVLWRLQIFFWGIGASPGATAVDCPCTCSSCNGIIQLGRASSLVVGAHTPLKRNPLSTLRIHPRWRLGARCCAVLQLSRTRAFVVEIFGVHICHTQTGKQVVHCGRCAPQSPQQ